MKKYFLMCLFGLAYLAGHYADAAQPKEYVRQLAGEHEGLKLEFFLSTTAPLPYEPIRMIVKVTNTTTQDKSVMAIWALGDFKIWFRKAGDSNWQKGWFEMPSLPPSPSEKILKPGHSFTWTGALGISESGEHEVKVQVGGVFETDVAKIEVVKLPEAETKAYNDLGVMQGGVLLYAMARPYTVPPSDSHVRAIEGFLEKHKDSQYVPLSKLTLAVLWMNGVDGKKDFKKAAEILSALEQNGTRTIAYQARYYLGKLSKVQGEDKEARKHFQGVLDAKPDPFFKFLAEEALKAN